MSFKGFTWFDETHFLSPDFLQAAWQPFIIKSLSVMWKLDYVAIIKSHRILKK